MQSYHCFDPELFLSSPRKSAAAGKFVLLQRLQEVILLIGQLSSYPYHADLVQAFAERHAIPFQRASVREKTVLTSNNHELFGGVDGLIWTMQSEQPAFTGTPPPMATTPAKSCKHSYLHFLNSPSGTST